MDDLTLARLQHERETPQQAPFALSGSPQAAARVATALRSALLAAGHPEDTLGRPRLVLHTVDPERPRPYHRGSRATFVIALVEVDERPDDVLRVAYPYLVQALANLCVLVAANEPGVAHVVTLEQGHYEVPLERDGVPDYALLYERLRPLALSRLVIENDHVPDLPPTLWNGDAVTAALGRAGVRLDALGLLPSPFPLEQYLSIRERRHVRLLFGIGGLSYGNMSARRDHESFWMTASGVNKSTLRKVGEDLVLVSGFDPERLALRLSEPPGLARPARASVDAIEHWMIYRRHTEVGAIVHIHAWMDGVRATTINYPCGTLELATAVADLVRAAPDPMRAVVGQKNHGLTITGPDLDDIFERIEGRIASHVPMAA